MSKSLPSGLAAHYAQPATALCQCLEVIRTDGQALRVTNAQRDLVVAGQTYRAEPGLDVGDVVATAGFAVDNLTLTVIPDDTAGASRVTRADLLAGRWTGATFRLFECAWSDPTHGVNTLRTGTVGEVQLARGSFVVELRGLKQALQQPVGDMTSRTCRARLGDARCTVDLAPWTHAGTVSASAGAQQFTASALAEPADYYVEGEVAFTSGANAGLSRKVKAYTAGKVFTLALPLPAAIAIGDAFTAVAGCQKRHDVDCRDKFANLLNFQGEPHLPGIDALTSPAEADVSGG